MSKSVGCEWAAESRSKEKRQDPFEAMTRAGAKAYRRARDLPRLLPLWPHEIADESPEGGRRLVVRLRKALAGERRRGRAGHWTYDLNRHIALLSAYKGELAMLEALGPQKAGEVLPTEPVRGATAGRLNAGAARAPSFWQGRSGRPRNSAQPSDSRAADPISPGTPREKGRNACADDASMT